MFLCEFCKIVKNIFWQDTSGWLLLVFICEFWEVVQITSEYLWETSYFKYKLLDFNHQIQDSAASRCILVPFERYGRPKNVFPYMFHVKPKWNIICKYSTKIIFSRDSNILPQMHWTKDIFGHATTIIGGLGVSHNYPILNFKKTICPKNVRMQEKSISQVLFKHFIEEQEVAIWRLEAATRCVL